MLFSGGGRTLENLVEASRDGRLDAEVTLAISSSPSAGGIERCGRLGVPCETIRPRDFEDPAEFSETVFRRLRSERIDLVCLAGYLTLLPIPDDYLGRVLNIHPALLPEFGGQGMYGDRVHAAVLAAGRTQSGCTVHFANNEYDAGPVIVQLRCPVEPDDHTASLAARVFELERRAYPEAVRRVLAGETTYEDSESNDPATAD